MRILLSTDVVGGVWSYTATLARQLAERGHRCTVAVVGRADDRRLSALPDGVDVRCRDLRLEWEPGGIADVPKAARWIAEQAADARAEIVHLGQLSYAIADFTAPVVVVTHSDVCSWYEEARGMDAPVEWTSYARVVEAGLRSADFVVAPTEYQATRVRRHYGRAVDRVIPNGVEIPQPLANGPGRSPGRHRILTVGRAWDEAKGVEILDRALESLGADAPGVDLIGAIRHAERQARRVGSLSVHGPLDPAELRALYREARLYIGPSLYEPFGLAPAEAAAQGCALLLSGIGSFRELWQDAAFFFEPGDPADLARTLVGALSDPALCDEMGRRAAYRVRTRFTAARMASAYERVYETLAARHARAAGARRAATSLELARP